MAPEVLAHLADRVGLENNSDFREAISVSAYSPSTPGILKKYDQNLSRSNLSTTEIDAINAALTEELARTTERTVRISIDGRARSVTGTDRRAGYSLAGKLDADLHHQISGAGYQAGEPGHIGDQPA